MFIELTDSYNNKAFCLNINFIKAVHNNGRYTIVTTADNQYSVWESYDEIIKKIKQAVEACDKRGDREC